MPDIARSISEIETKFVRNHIRQEGARFHVLSWGLCHGRLGRDFGTTWCSDPFCEVNLKSVLDCIENGLDPARIIPSVEATKWLEAVDA